MGSSLQGVQVDFQIKFCRKPVLKSDIYMGGTYICICIYMHVYVCILTYIDIYTYMQNVYIYLTHI